MSIVLTLTMAVGKMDGRFAQMLQSVVYSMLGMDEMISSRTPTAPSCDTSHNDIECGITYTSRI